MHTNCFGGLNIGDFIQKSPLDKVYSSPIFPPMVSISATWVLQQKKKLVCKIERERGGEWGEKESYKVAVAMAFPAVLVILFLFLGQGW